MIARVAALVYVATLAAGCAAERGTIGAMLAQRSDGTLFVHSVPPRLAAERAGLRPGDQLLLIDGMDVRMLDDQALVRTLNGEVGSPVRLTVIRGEEVLRVTVKRTAAPPKRRRRTE